LMDSHYFSWSIPKKCKNFGIFREILMTSWKSEFFDENLIKFSWFLGLVDSLEIPNLKKHPNLVKFLSKKFKFPWCHQNFSENSKILAFFGNGHEK
jgi:hypothetical protein